MSAHVKVGFDGGAVTTGLAKLKHQMHETRESMNEEFGIGKFLAAGAIVEGFHAILEKAAQIAHTGEQFGVPVEALQRISNAAKLVGVDMNSVGTAMNKSVLAQEKVRKGNTEMTAAVEGLGIKTEEFINMTPDEVMYKLADAYVAAEDKTKAYAEVVEILGTRTGGHLIPMLAKGSEEMRRMGEAAGVMSASQVEMLHEAEQKIETVKNKMMIWGGEALIWIHNIAQSAGAFVGTIVGQISRLWDKSAPDWSQASKAYEEQLDEIWNKKGEGEEGKKPVRTVEDSEEEARGKEKLEKTYERINEIRQEGMTDALEGQEKLNDLIARQQALYEQAGGEQDAQKQADLWVKAEEINRKIMDERKRIDKEAESAAERVAKQQETLKHKKMETALAGAKSKEEKLAILSDAMQKLDFHAIGVTDPSEKLHIEEQKEDLKKQMLDVVKKPEYLAADNLAKVGGGGRAYIMPKDPNIERVARAAEASLKAQQAATEELKKIHTDLTHARWNP